MESLGDIAVFVQVVREGSFTAAAERLDLSRSVVSKYVTRLEAQLGVRLLNRTTRRLSLTEAGQIFYERSRRGLQDIEEAREAVSMLQDEPRGVLRINSPMSFGIQHVAPALPGFLDRYPEIEIDMNLDDRMVDVIAEGFDISLRITQELPESSLVARRLAPCRHVVVATPAYLDMHGTPRTPADLGRHNVLSFRYQEAADTWHFQAPDGSTVSVPVKGSVRMNNSLALRESLLGGLGIMRTPSFVVGADLEAGRLLALLPGYRTLDVSIYLVYPQRRHLSPKVRAFVDYMTERMSDPPYWDTLKGSAI